MHGEDGFQKHQCILCNVFSNSNLKPSKLKEHFNNKHGGSNVTGRDSKLLKIKRARFDSFGTVPRLGMIFVDKSLLLALYKVAYKVSKSKKSYTIAGELIKRCAIKMAANVLGQNNKKLILVPLTNNTMQNPINEMSEDVLVEVITNIKFSSLKISLQLDESTNVTNCNQLIALVRHVNDSAAAKEEFLFCEKLKATK